jgi:DNA (cytosine-5)-methyltransferase 1
MHNSFDVSFHPTRERWAISINASDGRGACFTIRVAPLGLLSWSLPTRSVVLSGNVLDREAFTGCWKAFETELARLHIKADLVQLCGYYQYEPAIVTQMEILRRASPFWTGVARVVAGVGTRVPIPAEKAASVWGLPDKEVWAFAEFLRTLGYEVRNNNTNPQIPEGTLLVPYPFPTLSHQSVQFRKDLGQ